MAKMNMKRIYEPEQNHNQNMHDQQLQTQASANWSWWMHKCYQNNET